MKVIAEAIFGFCCNSEENTEAIVSFVVENFINGGLVSEDDKEKLIRDVDETLDFLRVNRLLKCEYFMNGLPYLKTNSDFSEVLGYNV